MAKFMLTLDQVSREQELGLIAALKAICPATEVKGNVLKVEANETTAAILRGMAMAFLRNDREQAISNVFRKNLTAWCDSKYYSINEAGELCLIVDLEESATAATESDEIEYIDINDIDLGGNHSLRFDLDRWNAGELAELIESTPSKIGKIDPFVESPLYSFIPATINIDRDRRNALAIFRERCMTNYKDWVKRNHTDNPCYQYDSFYVGHIEYCIERKTGRIFAA